MQAAAPPTRSPWLFGRNLDLLAFVGPVVVAIAFVLIGRAVGLRSTPPWAFLTCVIVVDVAHVHGTLYRVYLDPAEVKRRKLLYLGTPLLAYAVGVALHLSGGALRFWRVLAYFAVWHFVRQQIGWVALYRVRAGELADPSRRVDRYLDPAVTYAATLYPLVYWHATLPKRFSWFMRGDFFVVSQRVGQALLPFAHAVWAALLLGFALRQVQLFATGRTVNVGKVLVVSGTALLWWLGIVHWNDDYSFTVTNVLPHGIPYFVLVLLYARRRFTDPDAAPARLGQRLFAGGVALAFLALVVLAFFEEWAWDLYVWHDHEPIFGEGRVLSPTVLAFLVPILALPQAVHYVTDGYVWRGRENPDLRKYL